MLTITAQQSRFHNEAIEGSALKELVVKDLSISVGQREILSHAQFQLQVGKHYVLVGRNGIGKSTLLQAIASDQIPSIPQSLRVLLLGQTQLGVEDDLSDLKQTDLTVLQHVIKSDRKRERLLDEERLLSAAMDNTKDSIATVIAYRTVCHERLEQRTHVAKQIALRRSGARGAKAKKALLELEAEMKESRAKLHLSASDIDPSQIGEETQGAADLLSEIQSMLEVMGASGADAQARSILLGLGFSEEAIDQPMTRLSGGWQSRCSVAAALCQSADLLLLDEPTNFLDLPSIIWLENYIQNLSSSTTVLVVTHDRAFADSVAEELLVMRNLGLERFRGNLSAYELERMKKYKYLTRMQDALDKKKKHMEKSVENNVKAAKRTGDDKKLKQAASRKKKLEERTGMEVSAKGTKFKLNRDLGGYHLTNRDAIDIPDFDAPVRFSVPVTPTDLRFPGALLSMEKVGYAYPQKKKTPVLQEVDLTIHIGERVGICGRNGSGKSTLVLLAMAGADGSSSSTKPTAGSVTRHTRAKFGLYSQQSAEQLNGIAAENPQLTALSHLLEYAGGELEEKDARAILGNVGLTGKIASDIPIALLSGGQKVRLAVAKLLWNPPHLLILDEVTTHLDTDTIEALVFALRKYEGAVLVVTHDRFFMRCVVEGESPKSIARNNRLDDDEDDVDSSEEDDDSSTPGVVYRMLKGKLKKLEGGMLKYEELAAKASTKMGKT